jgi:hypothetical protein
MFRPLAPCDRPQHQLGPEQTSSPARVCDDSLLVSVATVRRVCRFGQLCRCGEELG